MATLYKTDGTWEEIKPANGKNFTLEELQGYVGGYIEPIYLNAKDVLIVNEEGLPKGLALNEPATIIAGQQIVGDAVLMLRKQLK